MLKSLKSATIRQPQLSSRNPIEKDGNFDRNSITLFRRISTKICFRNHARRHQSAILLCSTPPDGGPELVGARWCGMSFGLIVRPRLMRSKGTKRAYSVSPFGSGVLSTELTRNRLCLSQLRHPLDAQRSGTGWHYPIRAIETTEGLDLIRERRGPGSAMRCSAPARPAWPGSPTQTH